MFKKRGFLLVFGLIFFIFNTSSSSLENKILVKIENQIITSLDVNNEYKYLVALNPSIKNSKKNDILTRQHMWVIYFYFCVSLWYYFF